MIVIAVLIKGRRYGKKWKKSLEKMSGVAEGQ